MSADQRRSSAPAPHPAPGPTDVAPIHGSFPAPRGRRGTMSGSVRVERVVELDGSTTVEAVFTGHLLDGDGARIGVGSRRQQVPATLVRGPEGSWLSVGAVEVDLLGLPVSVPGFTVATTGASRRFGRPDAAARPHTPEELR